MDSSTAPLSPEQEEALARFIDIAGIQDTAHAAALLASFDWNLEAAVASVVFDESSMSGNVPTTTATTTTAAESVTRHRSPQSSSPQSRPQQSPDTPVRDLQRAQTTSPVLSVLSFPFTLGFKIAYVLFGYTFTLFKPFLTSTPPNGSSSATSASSTSSIRRNDPQAAASRFLLNFETKYPSAPHPDFLQGTYSQALDLAKREIRYLLAILSSPDHDDTDTFNTSILTSNAFLSFLRQHEVLVWAGDIHESEAYQVSHILSCTRYPFMALICPQGSRMMIADRVEGLQPLDQIITSFETTMNRVGHVILQRRFEREAREAERRMRQEQDEAYQASLRADQEKARKAEQEALEQSKKAMVEANAETERRQKLEAKRQRKQLLKESLAPEPTADSVPAGTALTKISIKLPNGTRVIRRFTGANRIQDLYDFVDTFDLEPTIPLESDFVIINTYPRKEFRDKGMSFVDAGLVPDAAVVVEEDS